MDSTPDAVLRHALDYLPSKAFLPIANVSKRFRFVWLADDVSTLLHINTSNGDDDERKIPAKPTRNVDDGERKIPAKPTRNGDDDERKIPAKPARNGDDDERKIPAKPEGNDKQEAPADAPGVTQSGSGPMEVDSDQVPTTSAAELRAVWSSGDAVKKTEQAKTNRTAQTPSRNRRLTNPLQIGNLFSVPWNKPRRKALNTALLAYYIDAGWTGKCKMRGVLTGAAARGDIEGMQYIFDNKLYPEDDIEICTIAAAAGRLEALIWLREERKLPWDPTEIHRESSENLHEDVMEYVEKNSEGHKIQLSYGVGLPW